MTATSTRLVALRRVPRSWLWLILALVVAGWTAFTTFAFVAGNQVGGLQLEDAHTGKVIVVNYDGSKFCYQPDNGSAEVCGAPWQRGGSPRLRAGERVTVVQATSQRTGEIQIIEH